MDIGGGDIDALQLNGGPNDGEQENVNISDVLEAITLADPLFGGGVDTMARPPARQPIVEIEEQPASKALRFRYECEGRSAGSIPGVNSTAENKTYPTLRVKDYLGPCTIVASCVTKDEPFRPHPHNLVGRERCDRGVCTIRANITEENPLVPFKNLGIQCVKKKDIEAALQQRAQLRVDPFRTGFDSRTYPSIELNSVRLAFQVFLPDSAGQMRHALRAVVSDVIHDKKAMGDLCIVRASHCSGSTRGGTQMILLCEKVSREEVTVMFYDKSGWKAPATVQLVHKQVAIVIETPPYRDPATSDHINVEYRLQRGTSPAEDDQSKPFPFEYIPELESYPVKKRKTLIQSLIHYDDRSPPFQPDHIKIEPIVERSPTHALTSPQHMYSPVSPYQDQQQRWGVPGGDGMLNVARAAFNPFSADMPWQYQPPHGSQPAQPQYAVSPSSMHLQAFPPMGQGQPSPMGHRSPHSPGMVSPNLNAQMGHNSPMGHAASPGLQMGAPGLAGMGHAQLQPVPMGHIAPAQQLQSYQQQQQQQQHQQQQLTDAAASMESGTPSISGLLATGTPSISGLLATDVPLALSSSDLFNLSSMADQNLSDSLKRLSTSDLQF